MPTSTPRRPAALLAAAPQKPSPAALTAALAASLKRCAFLLNSSRLVITDPTARATAGQAVDEACGLLREVQA